MLYEVITEAGIKECCSVVWIRSHFIADTLAQRLLRKPLETSRTDRRYRHPDRHIQAYKPSGTLPLQRDRLAYALPFTLDILV